MYVYMYVIKLLSTNCKYNVDCWHKFRYTYFNDESLTGEIVYVYRMFVSQYLHNSVISSIIFRMFTVSRNNRNGRSSGRLRSVYLEYEQSRFEQPVSQLALVFLRNPEFPVQILHQVSRTCSELWPRAHVMVPFPTLFHLFHLSLNAENTIYVASPYLHVI